MPAEALAAGLHLAARQYRTLLGPEVAAMACLAVIDRQGPLRVSALATELILDPSTTSRHVAQLERAELLERHSDPADLRAVLLKLTPAGHARLAQWRDQQARLLATATRTWSAEDVTALTGLLHRLAEDLATLDQGAAS